MKTKFKWLLALIALVASVNVWGATSKTATYIVATASTLTVANAPEDASYTLTGDAALNSSMLQFTYGKSKTLTLEGYDGCKITGFSMDMKSNSKAGLGSMSIKVGTTTLHSISSKNFNDAAWYGNWSSTSVPIDFTESLSSNPIVKTGETIVIEVSNPGTSKSANSIYVGKFSITYEEGDDPDPTKPSLSVSPTTIDFGTVYKDAEVDAKDVTVTFANLTTNDVAAAISGSAFSVDKTGSFTSGDKITITPSTATLGEYEETLTLSATGVDDQTVTVKMNVVEAPAPTGTFAKYTGDITEGDYVIVSTNALSNTVNANRIASQTVTISDDKIVNPDEAIIWHIAASGDYWTLYNAAVEKYAASTNSKNQATMAAGDLTDNMKWTITGSATYEFENLARSTGSDSGNKWLRYNSGNAENSRWACYGTGTGGALTLYKKKAEGNVPVTGVSLPATAFIKTGGTQQLNPTFTPFDATNKNVTWEVIDGSAYIEVSDAGLVTAKAEGEGTVKVTTEDGGFTATCVVTVKNGIANTKETAYTVAQALALYDAGFDLEATVYVKGVITSISGTGKNNIYIKDAEQSNSFEFYGLVDGDATVSSLTQYDTIIGHGQLDKFNTTYEFKSGCVLDERKAYVAPTILIDPTNTPETAYTPAEVINIYDNGDKYDLTKAVYVKGVVTSKPALTTSGDWKGSYYQVVVAAAGTETPTFTFFHMFAGAESAKFTEDVVNAKDTVIAYGTLTKYNTTYELAERCYMYERKPYQAKVTGVTIDNKEGLTVAAHESITLTATIAEAGATGTLVWSVIAGDTYASIDQTGKVTGIAAGEATIQVQVEGTEFTDQCTVTITAAYEGATLPYSFDDGRNSTDPAFSQNGLGTDYASSPKLKFDSQGDEVVFHIAEAPAYMSFDIKGNGSPWAGQFDVLESADNSSYTSVVSYSALESSTTSLNVLLTGTSRYIKFVYTTKTSGNVALGNINILATAPKQDPEFSIDNVDVLVDGNAPLVITTNSDGVVTYTIDPDNSGIEIIDGTVYAHTEGTYTVIADKAETEAYNAAQTTFTVSVSSVAYKTAEVTTFTAIDGGLLELGQFHSYKGGANTPPAVSDGQIRLYQNGGYIKISALPGLKIAKIDIASGMATSYNYKVDAAEEYALTDAAALAKDATANIAGLTADSVRIYCLGTDKNSRFYVSYLKVYYAGELETVSALAVDGATKTEYEVNDEVDHTGAVVTATFATAGDVDVTLNSTFTDPDMSTSGTKQVTANFAEQTATYDITIAAETPEIEVDVTSVGFGTVAQNDEVDAKTVAVTLKAIAEATVAVTGDVDAFDVTPASLTESGDITITPVTTTAGEFAATITISADGAESKTISVTMNVTDGNLPKEKVDFTEVYSDVTGSSTVDFASYSGVTFSLTAAKNDGSQPKYYANGSSVRAYAKNTITISSEKTIAFILINYTSAKGQDDKAEVSAGNLIVNEKYGMWTLGAKEGTLTVGATCSFDNITVYYEYDEVARSAQSENQIGTGCQTLDIVAVKGATLYQVNYTYGCYLEFMEVTYPVKAGMPIIMQADNTNDGKIEVIYGQKSPVATEGLDKDGLYGYIGSGQFNIPEGSPYYVFKGGMLRPSQGNYTTSGHAYIKLDEVPTEDQLAGSPAPRRRMSVGVERSMPTGFETIMMQKGMNKVIMNNQLFIIRDGKVFNAQGALVK
ncbi:MAG: Ig-like domain-containing protein [Bacteroidaceae bacterium]|nr:Ig-like domain-containing protein [Bacteroidaceae bacterium]